MIEFGLTISGPDCIYLVRVSMSKVKTEHSSHSHRTQGDGTAPNPNPLLGQRGRIVQEFGTVIYLPSGLSDEVRKESTHNLNQLLADTMMLRDMYKKHHWQVSGHTFYQLHLLLDKHYEEQSELVDTIAERIQALGGVALALPHDVAEQSRIERPPIGREEVPAQLSRLLEAHELILKESHEFAKTADDAGDDGTNDLIVSDVIRTNEMQVWFIAEHLVAMPLVKSE